MHKGTLLHKETFFRYFIFYTFTFILSLIPLALTLGGWYIVIIIICTVVLFINGTFNTTMFINNIL